MAGNTTVTVTGQLVYSGQPNQSFTANFTVSTPEAPMNMAIRSIDFNGSVLTAHGYFDFPDIAQQNFAGNFTVPGAPVDLILNNYEFFYAGAMPSLFSITPGREFAANSWVHTRLAPDAPLDPQSAALSANLLTFMKATSPVSYMQDAQPLYIIPPGTPTITVISQPPDPGNEYLQYKTDFMQSKVNAVPIPNPDTFVVEECPPGVVCDHNVTVYQPSTGLYWELGGMYGTWTPGLPTTTVDSTGRTVKAWEVVWGGRMGDPSDANPSVATNQGTWIREDVVHISPPDPTLGLSEGLAATAVPIMALMITMGDFVNPKDAGDPNSQRIEHPLYFFIPWDRTTYLQWNSPPAQRTDGQNSDPPPATIPEGAIFRFPANIDFEAYNSTKITDPGGRKHTWRMIAEAIRDYGMCLADTGGAANILIEEVDTPQYPPGTRNGRDELVAAGLWVPYMPFGGPDFPDSDFPWDKLQCLKLNLVGWPV